MARVPRSTDPSLAEVPAEEILAELRRRQSALRVLLARRARLAEQLASVEAEILDLGGRDMLDPAAGPSAASDPSPRPARPGDVSTLPLPAAIAGVMELGDVISPREAAGRVVAAGYRTTAANFGAVVIQALSRDKRFRRVARGRYERIA